MIDRVLNFGPVQQESYYFQLIPLSLSIVNASSELPAQGTTYKFTVSKGLQKFEENKIPIEANFQVVNSVPVLVINTCRLNFYLPNYNKARKNEFSLVMVQRENSQDYELGEYKISVDELVIGFKENNKSRFELKTNFTDDYELEFQIYIEKNRMALERNIRENRTERINKSPLRARKDEKTGSSVQRSLSNKREDLTPSRDREESVNEPTPSEPASQNEQEEKAEIRTEIYEEKVQTRYPTPPPIVNERSPSPAVEEIKTSPKRQQRISFTKQESSQIREKSQKNEVQSRKSKDNVPVITIKQKQLAPSNTPAEINLTESQRLGTTEAATSASKPNGSSSKEQLLLWLFLIVSGVIMYYSMRPNRKV